MTDVFLGSSVIGECVLFAVDGGGDGSIAQTLGLLRIEEMDGAAHGSRELFAIRGEYGIEYQLGGSNLSIVGDVVDAGGEHHCNEEASPTLLKEGL